MCIRWLKSVAAGIEDSERAGVLTLKRCASSYLVNVNNPKRYIQTIKGSAGGQANFDCERLFFSNVIFWRELC